VRLSTWARGRGVPDRAGVVRLSVAGLWVAALALGALVGSNLAGMQGGFVVNTAQTLVPLTLVAAGLVTLAAAMMRHWALATVAGVVVVGHLVLVMPALGPASTPVSGAEVETGRLRVFSANLHFANPDVGPIAREIVGSDANVVALQEVTETHLASLRAAGVVDMYPHTLLDPRSGGFGSAILSKTPVTDARVVDLAGVPMSRATLLVGDRPVELFNVHTMAPVGTQRLAARDRQLDALALMSRADSAGPDGDDPRAHIVVGDFNASRWHPAFRRLLDLGGLHDAHEQAGRGLARTWPNESLLPRFALLDHVLLSPTVSAVAVREATGEGSDHRPVVADLRVR